MKNRAGEENDPRELQVELPEIQAPLTNKAVTGKKAKKKADSHAETPDVDPGIDFMRWSE